MHPQASPAPVVEFGHIEGCIFPSRALVWMHSGRLYVVQVYEVASQRKACICYQAPSPSLTTPLPSKKPKGEKSKDSSLWMSCDV